MTVFNGCLIVLVVGRRLYIRSPPSGSLIVRAYRLTMMAIRMRWRLGKQQDCQHILDYANETLLSLYYDGKDMVTEFDQNRFIEDLKRACKACRVFAFYPFFWVCCIQMSGNLISQAAQMNVGPLPNDVMQNIQSIMVLILIPVFDKMIYPTLR